MKTILLLDHGIAGHKYAFAKLFAKYLLRLNFKVILVLPEKTEQIKAELAESEGELVRYLYPVNQKIKEVPNLRVHKKMDPILKCIYAWYETKKLVRLIEKKSFQKIDVVFLCALGKYVINYLPHRLIDLIFPYQWSGLYLHPWFLFNTDHTKVSISSQDNVLRAKNCIGCGVHDETLQTKLASRIQKPVLYFPEIADGSPPMGDYEITIHLKEKAKNKPVVGLIGLAKRKGLLHLLEVIKKDTEKYFFYFLAGKIPYDDYTAGEREIIEKFIFRLHENVYYYNDAIPEGPAINSLIATFKIVYLVYNNFKSSSNFLTKAVIFRKMSVGIDTYWIGENIQKYNLGLTVDGYNPSDTLNAFHKIAKDNHNLCPQWDDFLSRNGEKQLLHTFRELLK